MVSERVLLVVSIVLWCSAQAFVPATRGQPWSPEAQTPLKAVMSAKPPPPSSKAGDLLVVGSGTLGVLVGQMWKKMFGDAVEVVGETFSTSRHEQLKGLGITPLVRSEREAVIGGSRRFPYVVFCVPPSKEEDYAGEVTKACRLWSGEGAFIFTSSGGVYAEDSGAIVDDSSPVSRSQRTERLLQAEKAALDHGGMVMRLAGLYTPTRGPHTFWLAKGEVQAVENGLINMLHYEDAASAVLVCLLQATCSTQPRVLLVSDDNPLTRRQICEAALSSPLYESRPMPAFKPPAGAPPSLGKLYNTTSTRQVLKGWAPRYPSFSHTMANSH